MSTARVSDEVGGSGHSQSPCHGPLWSCYLTCSRDLGGKTGTLVSTSVTLFMAMNDSAELRSEKLGRAEKTGQRAGSGGGESRLNGGLYADA